MQHLTEPAHQHSLALTHTTHGTGARAYFRCISSLRCQAAWSCAGEDLPAVLAAFDAGQWPAALLTPVPADTDALAAGSTPASLAAVSMGAPSWAQATAARLPDDAPACSWPPRILGSNPRRPV